MLFQWIDFAIWVWPIPKSNYKNPKSLMTKFLYFLYVTHEPREGGLSRFRSWGNQDQTLRDWAQNFLWSKILYNCIQSREITWNYVIDHRLHRQFYMSRAESAFPWHIWLNVSISYPRIIKYFFMMINQNFSAFSIFQQLPNSSILFQECLISPNSYQLLC